MDWTIEEYLAFEQHLLEQAEKDADDDEIPVDEPVYWCYN